MLDLAIIGGGPGGLMSAWYLKKKLGPLCRVTIYEASSRVGGKILTKTFDTAPAMYEAGVAEISKQRQEMKSLIAKRRFIPVPDTLARDAGVIDPRE